VELTIKEAKATISYIAKLMKEHRDLLTELDRKIGDGDLGITMNKAFKAAEEEMKKVLHMEPGKFFMKMGMAIAKAAPSTMGTLLATGFMRGGKAIVGKPDLLTEDLAVFFEHFTQGILERGKARIGDKTVLDVLTPIAETLAVSRDKPLPEALAAAEREAVGALEETKLMISQRGKAAVFREQTIGIQDPGGTVAYLIIRAFHLALTG